MSNTSNEETAIEPGTTGGLALPPDAMVADVADRLIRQARDQGIALAGTGGLLTGLVQQVMQASLETELTDHLGYEAHAVEGRGSGNSRNGLYPTDQAALKVLYLTSLERKKNRQNPTGRVHGWKQILNMLSIHYQDRLEAAHY